MTAHGAVCRRFFDSTRVVHAGVVDREERILVVSDAALQGLGARLRTGFGTGFVGALLNPLCGDTPPQLDFPPEGFRARLTLMPGA